MSLFIGALAFPNDPVLVEQAKLGVLTGLLASAIVGFLVLCFVPAAHRSDEPSVETAAAPDAIPQTAQVQAGGETS